MMARIGFRLKKMLSEETYSGLLKGYLFSSVISSGPWIISIIYLSLIGLLNSFMGMGSSDVNIFGTSIIYIFVFSFALSSISQPVITRALSDELYGGRRQTLGSMFITLIFLTLVILAIIGVVFSIFFAPSNWSFLNKIVFVVMLIIVGVVWQLMVFLSASTDYKIFVGIFLIASLVSVFIASLSHLIFGLFGYFVGFTLVQSLICFTFLYKVFEDYPVKMKLDFSFIKYFKLFPELAFIGFGNYFGIWIDKFIFWWSGVFLAESISVVYPFYNTAMFLAFLTVIPAMVYFLVEIETNFYLKYREFYQSITHKKPLYLIMRRKEKMIGDLKKSFFNLFKIQSALLTAVLFFAPALLPVFNFPLSYIGLFRLAVCGVFCYTVIVIISIILLYFDLKKPVVFIYLFLFGTNALFTAMTLLLGENFFGWGYFLSAFLSSIVASVLLVYYLKDLEYHSFINQPLVDITGESYIPSSESCGVHHIRFGKVNRIG